MATANDNKITLKSVGADSACAKPADTSGVKFFIYIKKLSCFCREAAAFFFSGLITPSGVEEIVKLR